MAWDFSCHDWADRLRRGVPPMPDLPLDRAQADRAVGIFNNLRLPDVAGHPRLEDAAGDWFRALVSAAFGCRDPETGENQVGEIFCLVPKKNAKTTNSAALGITALLMNETPNAEMMIVGPTKEVADTCFSQAAGIINADPVDEETGRAYLIDRFQVRDHIKEIVDRVTGAVLKVKAFDKKVITGDIPKLTIIDELHVLGGSAHAAGVLTQIRGGMITRPDALLLFITTQSDDAPAGVFKSELDYARRVRDGAIQDGNTLPCLYEFPEAMQLDKARPWRDPKTWPMVLPNLGRSITIPRLTRLYRKAVELGPAEEIRWASQHLNIQVGMGAHDGRWIGGDLWPNAAAPASLEDILAAADVATIGVDGGGLDDLLGLAVIARDRETRVWRAWARAWVQPEALKKRPGIAPKLQDFADLGEMVICDDPTADLREVAGICREVADLGLLPEEFGIGLDPFGVAALVDELAAVGLEGRLLSAIPQGARLSPAIWGLERKLKDGTFTHCDQGLMNWSVDNAKTEKRGNAVMITKAVSGSAKIDPLIALFNAASLMARNPVASGRGMDDFLANPVMCV